MKFLLQIFLLFIIWFTNTVNATPVFTRVACPSCQLLVSKAENHKQESEVKIGVSNFARSNISENEFSCSAFVGVAWKGVAGRFINKQTELGVNLLQNKEMIVKECGFKYIQPEGR